MSSSLTIVSLNTWKGEGEYSARLEWMARGLQALAPDVVFLQEAFECPAVEADTADRLAKALDLHSEPLRARQKKRLVQERYLPSWSNLAVLTKNPSRNAKVTKLAGHSQEKDRWALCVEVSLNDHPLRLINAHFTHCHDEEGHKVRARQAEQVAAEAAAAGEGLVVFGGDLNTTPDTEPIRTLSGVVGFLPIMSPAAGGTMQGECFDADKPVADRIDFLFVRSCTPTLSRRISLIEAIAMTEPVGPNGEFPSDHAAVVLTLTGLGQE